MHVITVSNRKGGTGKTTVSVNLASELALAGRRVLLIDLDSQGHCAVGLGIKVGAGEATVHRLFLDPEAKLFDAIRPTALDSLFLAPADPCFDHGTSIRNGIRLKTALADELLETCFDIVVIDTPPSLDALLMNALMCATRVLIPYVPHPLSFEGVRQLVRALFLVMTRHNKALKLLGLLPTMSTERVRQHRTVTGCVGKEFGESKILPAIRADIRLAEAMAAGKPIRLYAPKSRGAEDFARLTEEVIQRIDLFHDKQA